ncbi:hypothetical protein LARV_02964 [Longilinea arvoryzae]|uniref:Uncharacterized protein n=1 Tax=Longilinea arvoryzae TaxID=360412 RepID=A0A0S7BBW2_9CHLR|nr:hypothetical protein [Longilinea arvoryzae]GAP15182.1 hypothetical protein LARV_02964 [Longilinea arvoryzae]
MTPFGRAILWRTLISVGIALLLGVIVSEGSFYLQRTQLDRKPDEFDLVVPPGTADRIQAGLAVPSLPQDMTFVEGDVIVVKNEDSVSHQLGPIWVPAGSTGRLVLEKPNTYTLSCSFQPSQRLGLEVRPRLTAGIRFQGLLAVAAPTSVLVWLYLIVISPLPSAAAEEGQRK